DRFRQLLGPESTAELVMGQFDKSWVAEIGASDDRDGFAIQSSSFRMLSPTLKDWQKVLEIVGSLERLPGVGVASLKMKTSGNMEHREVDKMEVVVEIHSRRPEHSPRNS